MNVIDENEKGNVVDVPDIPMPEAAEPEEEVQDEVNGAFSFGFIGIGQGGSRIVESFHKLGYNRVCCINTNQQDLTNINIPDANKLVMDIGDGGAGKDLKKGEKAANKYSEEIYDLMKTCFGSGVEHIFVCCGTGGGTGAGGVESVVNIANNLTGYLKLKDVNSSKVGVIAALPKNSEGSKVASNSFQIVHRLFKLTEREDASYFRTVSPLITIDNEKINTVYPKLPVGKFWDVANKNISGLFHLFNDIAVKDSEYTSFDKADFEQVLQSGAITFGACPISDWSAETSISSAIRTNLSNNVLVGDFDLVDAESAACVFIAGKQALSEIPQDYLEHGFDMLNRIMSQSSVVHRGIYEGSAEGLTVYTIMAGLSVPEERLDELKKLSE